MVTVKRKIKSEVLQSSKRSKIAKVPIIKQETKKETISSNQQRRIQIKRYLYQYPTAKGRAVKEWILLLKPILWAQVTVRQLNQLIRNLKSSSNLKQPILDIIYNSNRPPDFSVTKWRSVQVKRYLKLNEEAKGKEIKSWIQKHNPNPWPEANARGINQMIKRQQRPTQQDPKMPIEYSLPKWRREQVDNYITTNPLAKGKKVKLCLQNHNNTKYL